jgi:hypothetical protein
VRSIVCCEAVLLIFLALPVSTRSEHEIQEVLLKFRVLKLG